MSSGSVTQLLFVQGAGEGTHEDWDRALVQSLEGALGADYAVRYPRMPDEAAPTFAAWQPAILHVLATLADGAILVGHSVGGTMLLHALADAKLAAAFGGLVLLAAPFIGTGGWPSDELAARTDFDLPAALPVLLFHGEDDDTVPVAHVHRYAAVLPHAKVHVLPGRDHQLNNDLGEVARQLRALR